MLSECVGMCYKCDPEPAWLGRRRRVPGHVGLGLRGSRSVPRQHQFPIPPPPPRGQHRLPHSVMHGERGCDVTMSRVSPRPHCHNVLVTLPRLPRVGRGMGSGGRCGSRAGARRGLGMYRSMTWSHASLEIRAGKHHQPHTCTRKSRGTNHHCAMCAED